MPTITFENISNENDPLVFTFKPTNLLYFDCEIKSIGLKRRMKFSRLELIGLFNYFESLSKRKEEKIELPSLTFFKDELSIKNCRIESGEKLFSVEYKIEGQLLRYDSFYYDEILQNISDLL